MLILSSIPVYYKRTKQTDRYSVLKSGINRLETKRSLLYIRNQSVPRSKYFPPRL